MSTAVLESIPRTRSVVPGLGDAPCYPEALPEATNQYCDSFKTRFPWAPPFRNLEPRYQAAALDWFYLGLEQGRKLDDYQRGYADGYQAAEQDSAALWADMSEMVRSLPNKSMAQRYRAWGETGKADALDTRAIERGYAI